MKYILIDYKGKHDILATSDYELDLFMDYKTGEIDEKDITDSWLKNHVDASIYYGVPALLGRNEALDKRIEKFYEEYDFMSGMIKRSAKS